MKSRKNSLFIVLLLLLCSCAPKDANITFTATIESVYDNSIMVTTSVSEVGFDKASVSYDQELKNLPDFVVGQEVQITILPEIMETYPVQVIAVKIKTIGEEQSMEYKKISEEEAVEMMSTDAVILDVRTQEEYTEGHIKDALLLPLDNIGEDTASELMQDKSKTVLVYCRTGRRSEMAAKKLLELGYTQVYDFGGITTDWSGEVVK